MGKRGRLATPTAPQPDRYKHIGVIQKEVVAREAELSAESYPPKSVATPFDGVASLVVDRGAGTGLGPKFWSSPAWVL